MNVTIDKKKHCERIDDAPPPLSCPSEHWAIYCTACNCRILLLQCGPTTLYLHRLMTRSACPPGLAGSRLQHAWWRKNRLFKVNTSCGLAGRSSFISGELKDGWDSLCLWLTGALLWPPRMPHWTASIHLPDLYPIDVFQLSFNFLCLLIL